MWPGAGHGRSIYGRGTFRAEGFRRCRMNAHHLTPLRAGPTSVFEAGPQANLFNAQFGVWFRQRQNFVAELPDFRPCFFKREILFIIQCVDRRASGADAWNSALGK
jgi:hypothetical protein